MNYRPFTQMPWDMCVFIAATTVGFGFSVHAILHPERAAERTIASYSIRVEENRNAADSSAVLRASEIRVLDLGCLENKIGRERLASQDGAIRLKGKFCNGTRMRRQVLESVKVRNTTNGYEGTVFYQDSGLSFSTDYLMLQSGKNHIELEWIAPHTREAILHIIEIFEK